MFSAPGEHGVTEYSLIYNVVPSSTTVAEEAESVPAAPTIVLRVGFSYPKASVVPAHSPSIGSVRMGPESVIVPHTFSSFEQSMSLPIGFLVDIIFP